MVFGRHVGGFCTQRKRADGAVAELQVFESLELRPQMMIPIIYPSVVDTTTFENSDLWFVERAELVEVLRIERLVIRYQEVREYRGVRPILTRETERESEAKERHGQPQNRDSARSYHHPFLQITRAHDIEH